MLYEKFPESETSISSICRKRVDELETHTAIGEPEKSELRVPMS
jgi:hypothetical protein